MSGDSALDNFPINGVKRRRLGSEEADAPAAKKSYTDAEIAAEVANSLNLAEQRRAEVRAVYLSYGTLIKGGDAGSEALAFQGLLDCADGSLGARRLAARLVPKFITRFPSHSGQAFRLLAELYTGTRRGDRGRADLPNGHTSPSATVAMSDEAASEPGTVSAAAAEGLEEAMRRDALRGLGNVMEAAARQLDRNMPVVLDLVMFLLWQLQRLCCATSDLSGGGRGGGASSHAPAQADGPVGGVRDAEPTGSSGHHAPAMSHRGGSVRPDEAEANGSSPLRDGHPDQRQSCDGQGRGKIKRDPGRARQSQDGDTGRGGGGDLQPACLDADLDPDSGTDAAVIQGLLRQAFCLFPRVVLAACLQPLLPPPPAGSSSGSGGQGVPLGLQAGRDGSAALEAACALLIGLLLRHSLAAGAAAREGCEARRAGGDGEGMGDRVDSGDMAAVAGTGGQRGEAGDHAAPAAAVAMVAASTSSAAGGQADWRAGEVSECKESDAAGSAGRPNRCAGAADAGATTDSLTDSSRGSGGGGSSCLAEQVLSKLPDTQAWLRQWAAVIFKGQQHPHTAARSAASSLRARVEQLLQFCPAAPVAAPNSAAAQASPQASPTGAGGGHTAAAPPAPAGSDGVPAGEAHHPAPRPAGSKGEPCGGAAPATHSVLGSDDGSRSVPMDLDQSISTVHRHEGAAGHPGAGGGGGGGGSSAQAGPQDTAATPAPPPPLPPPPPPPPPPHHHASQQHPHTHPLNDGPGAPPLSLPLPPPPPLPLSMSYSADAPTGLRGGPVCRAEACLYIGGLPPGLTQAALVAELSRSGAVESVHPYDQHQQPLMLHHAGPHALVGEEMYVVFVSLPDAAFCYEAIARTCLFASSRPLQVEFCLAFPADSPAARRRIAAAATASQYVWVSGGLVAPAAPPPPPPPSASGGAPVPPPPAPLPAPVTPEAVVAALQEGSLPVPQQILQVQGRAPGMLLQMAAASSVPQVVNCLRAAFALPPPIVAPAPMSGAGGATGPSGPAGVGLAAGAPPPPPGPGQHLGTAGGTSAAAAPYAPGQPQQHHHGGGPPSGEPPPPPNCRTIWIGQLHETVRDDELLSACRQHGGEVVGHRFLRASHCAFVDFATQAGADAARRALHGMRMGPQHLRVEWKLDSGQQSRAPMMMRNSGHHNPMAGGAVPGSAGMYPGGASAAPGALAAPPAGPPPGGAPATAPGPPAAVAPNASGAQTGQQPTPQAVAAASVAAAAAAVAARNAAFPGASRAGADRWAPAVIPPSTGAQLPQPPQPHTHGSTAFPTAGMNPAVAAAVRQASLILPQHSAHASQQQQQPQPPPGSAPSLPQPPQPPAGFPHHPAATHPQHHHQSHPSPTGAGLGPPPPPHQPPHHPAAGTYPPHPPHPHQQPPPPPLPPHQQAGASGGVHGRPTSPALPAQHGPHPQHLPPYGSAPAAGHSVQPQPQQHSQQPTAWSLSAAHSMPASGPHASSTLPPPPLHPAQRYGSAPPPPTMPNSPPLPPDGVGAGAGSSALPSGHHSHHHFGQHAQHPQPGQHGHAAQQHTQPQQAPPGPPVVTWQGGLAKSGSHMCTLQCTTGGASAASGASPGEREPVTWPATLDVKLRVDLSYVVHTLYSHTAPHARAMRRLVPAGGSDQRNKLSEFLSYLADKNRAGVIKLDSAAGLPPRTLYLVPPSEQVCAALGTEWSPREPCLLALVVPTTGSAGGGNKGGG